MIHWNCFKIWRSLENWGKFERNMGRGRVVDRVTAEKMNLDSNSSSGTGET